MVIQDIFQQRNYASFFQLKKIKPLDEAAYNAEVERVRKIDRQDAKEYLAAVEAYKNGLAEHNLLTPNGLNKLVEGLKEIKRN